MPPVAAEGTADRANAAPGVDSRRSQCTVAHNNGNGFGPLTTLLISCASKKITGLCKKSGLPFKEVMEHFLIGLEEACLVADAGGNVKILGEFGRLKHEKKVSD